MPKQSYLIEYEELNSPNELPKDEQNLLRQAWSARQKAYAPYSHFHVGSAVLSKDPAKIFTGNNQENANFKVSCAERTALDAIGVAGIKDQVFKIAVVGGPQNLNINEKPLKPEIPVTPCGQCRQDIKEAEDLAGEPITIILASRNLIRRFTGIHQLLPFAFGPSDLGISFRNY